MTNTGSRECVYCGSRPLTNEHAFPQWLSKEIQKHGTGGFDVMSSTFRTHAANVIDIQVKRICEPCHKWMNKRVEEPVQPVMRDIFANGTPLAPKQQTILARWAYKTTLMIELAHHYQPGLPSHLYDAFRANPLPDAHAFVCLGQFTSPKRAAHYERQGVAVLAPGDPLPSRGHNAYAATLIAYKAVFFIAIFPDGDVPHVPIADAFTQATLPLWPATGRPATWPPGRRTFTDNSIGIWLDMFRGGTTA